MRALKQSGYVLISILLFIFIITTLVLNSLENMQLHNQMTGYQLQTINSFHKSIAALKQIENKLVNAEVVIRDFNPHAKFFSENWWQEWGTLAFFSDIKTWYYIDVLMQNPCMQILNEPILGATFYRITIKVSDTNNIFYLQSIYAKPERSTEQCKEPITLLKKSEQSWQIFT